MYNIPVHVPYEKQQNIKKMNIILLPTLNSMPPSLDVIIDATSFSVELLERNGRIEAILLSARNVVRQRLLLCCFIDGV